MFTQSARLFVLFLLLSFTACSAKTLDEFDAATDTLAQDVIPDAVVDADTDTAIPDVDLANDVDASEEPDLSGDTGLGDQDTNSICSTPESDCDGRCVDLQTAPTDCGACNTPCTDTEQCVAGTCECLDGLGDCDADPTNGCESGLGTPEHCGSCLLGLRCDLFGIAPICEVPTGGGQGSCAPNCQPGYFDLDGDVAAAVSNGCETGFIEQSTTPLGLNGPVVETTVDELGQIFVATIATNTPNNVWVYAISLDNLGIPSIAGSVDTGAMAFSDQAVGLAASAGIVAVARRNAVNFYEYADGVFLNLRNPTLTDAAAVVALEPVLVDSIAELAVGSAAGLTWYAILSTVDATTSGMNCTASLSGTSVSLCTVTSFGGTSTNIITRLAAGRLGNAQWLVSEGTEMVEMMLFPAPPRINALSVSGDTLTGSAALAIFGNDSLIGVQGLDAVVIRYGFSGGIPSSRTAVTPVRLQGAAADLVLLDDHRAVVATDIGVEVIALGGSTAQLLTNARGAEGVASSGTQLVVFGGGAASVYDLALGPI